MKRNVLVTGAAGFIGAATVKRLILNGDNVIGVDNISPYYDVELKNYRLKELDQLSKNEKKWHFYKASLDDYDYLFNI